MKTSMNPVKPAPPQPFLSLLGLIGVVAAVLMLTVNAELEARMFPLWVRAVVDAGLLMALCAPLLQGYCRRLMQIARRDALTGLPNRELFLDQLEQGIALAKRSGKRCALVFVDLDRFKPVNDTYGHHVGDGLLREVAERLRQCVRASDMVARLGGDEFTVILPQVEAHDDVEQVVRKISAVLSRPFCVHGCDVELGVSMGIAVSPDHGDSSECLLKAADDAMYRAKSRDGSAYGFAERPPG